MTAILETALSRKATRADGTQTARKHLLAELMTEFVTTGAATMPDGKVLEASPKDWIETAKWIYTHIDGPPRQEVEATGGITIKIVYDNAGDPSSQAA